jgi:hypothetical protein
MVPHSSTPDPGAARPLSEGTALVLREAVRRTVGRPGSRGTTAPSPDADGALRDAVAAVVAEARERRMRPEELLPAFKALLDTIPEVSGASNRLDEARLRERLVTLCIKAYYET